MGYREDEQERALQEVPLYVADPVSWPKGVRVVGIDELGILALTETVSFTGTVAP